MRNVTEDVKKIVRFVQENCEKVGTRYGRTPQQSRLTLNMLVDIFIGKTDNRTPIKCIFQFLNLHICKKKVFFLQSGSKSAKVQTGMYGMGGAYSRHNADRLFKRLVLDNILMEDLYITNGGQAVCYISAGPKATNVLFGQMQVNEWFLELPQFVFVVVNGVFFNTG